MIAPRSSPHGDPYSAGARHFPRQHGAPRVMAHLQVLGRGHGDLTGHDIGRCRLSDHVGKCFQGECCLDDGPHDPNCSRCTVRAYFSLCTASNRQRINVVCSQLGEWILSGILGGARITVDGHGTVVDFDCRINDFSLNGTRNFGDHHSRSDPNADRRLRRQCLPEIDGDITCNRHRDRNKLGRQRDVGRGRGRVAGNRASLNLGERCGINVCRRKHPSHIDIDPCSHCDINPRAKHKTMTKVITGHRDSASHVVQSAVQNQGVGGICQRVHGATAADTDHRFRFCRIFCISMVVSKRQHAGCGPGTVFSGCDDRG